MSRNAARLLKFPRRPERGRASNVTSARDWCRARPRTLPARWCLWSWASGCVRRRLSDLVRSLYALIVALGIQIGTNYANDYADGIRGTDAERVGPSRLVAAGIAAPRR